MIDVKNLTLGYEAPVLKDISFSGKPGEVVGILGRNGSGKTTLLRGLLGSLRPRSGEIWIGGENCTGLRPRQLARLLAVLPQHTSVMEGITVREVLEMGRYPYGGWLRDTGPDTRQRVEDTARLLDIAPLLDRDCGRLSQGQRQMVLFGRLLVQDTQVLLLDEPNAALDYDNTQTLFSILLEKVRKEDRTALVILHDPELALRWCHRLLILRDGALRADISTQAEEDALTRALARLYPNIHVRKDPVDGCFRCYMNEGGRPC